MTEFLAYAGEGSDVLPPPAAYVWLVEDYTIHDSETIIAAFGTEQEAIDYADDESLTTDGRTITRLTLGRPANKWAGCADQTKYHRYNR